jgi:hypothetical protein
LDTLVTKDE